MGSALLLETGVVGVTGADAGEVEAWLLLVGLNLDHSGNVSRCTYRTTRSSRRWFLDLVVGWLVNMSKLSFGDWPVDETDGRVCFFLLLLFTGTVFDFSELLFVLHVSGISASYGVCLPLQAGPQNQTKNQTNSPKAVLRSRTRPRRSIYIHSMTIVSTQIG